MKYDDDESVETAVEANLIRMRFWKKDHVEARFGGRNRWYPAVVAKVNGDGTYDLRYDDGDLEDGVEVELTSERGGRLELEEARRRAVEVQEQRDHAEEG